MIECACRMRRGARARHACDDVRRHHLHRWPSGGARAISLDLFATLLGGTLRCCPSTRKTYSNRRLGLGILRAAPAVGALAISRCSYACRLAPVGRIMFRLCGRIRLATIVFGVSRSFALSLAALMIPRRGRHDQRASSARRSSSRNTRSHARAGELRQFALHQHVESSSGSSNRGWPRRCRHGAAVVIGGVGTLVIAACGCRCSRRSTNVTCGRRGVSGSCSTSLYGALGTSLSTTEVPGWRASTSTAVKQHGQTC